MASWKPDSQAAVIPPKLSRVPVPRLTRPSLPAFKQASLRHLLPSIPHPFRNRKRSRDLMERLEPYHLDDFGAFLWARGCYALHAMWMVDHR